MNTKNKIKNKKGGLSLIDVLVASALMLIVFVGISSAFRVTLELTFNNKAKASAISLANEKMELIRSLAYVDVGTLGGIPNGLIAQTENIPFNGIDYTRRTFIAYVDAPQDGIGVSDTNGVTVDYKVVKVEVSWVSKSATKKTSLVTNFVPQGIESTTGGGTLIVNVLDAAALPVIGADVLVVNNTVSPVISVNTFTDTSGQVMFPGSPSASEYEITVTKSGYSTAYTYPADASNPNPNPRHLSVVDGETTVATFQIDLVASKTVNTFKQIESSKWSDTFNEMSKISKFASTTITNISAGAWYDTAWFYRKKITVNNTKVSGTSDLVNFPVLINLTDSDLADSINGGNVGKSNGGDILFTSSDKTTKINHEIETYTATDGTLVAWVNVPVLSYNSDTIIYLYYGNASASDQENPTGVWDSSYAGVWHMSEDPSINTDGDCGGGTKEICDSTLNNQDGDSQGTLSLSDSITAKIGKGIKLDNDGEYLTVPHVNGNSLDITGGTITLEAWVNVSPSNTVDAPFIHKPEVINQERYMLGMDGDNDNVNSRVTTTEGHYGDSGSVIQNGVWTYVAMVYDDGLSPLVSKTTYKDGVLISTGDADGAILTTTTDVTFGRRMDGRQYYGSLDELRVSNVARTLGYITTSYNNQNSPSTFYAIAPEELIGGDLILTDVAGNYDQAGYAYSATVTPMFLYEWEDIVWNDNEPIGSDVKYKIYDASSFPVSLVPDSLIPGNSTGIASGPVDISGLSTTTYPSLQVAAFLTSVTGVVTASVQDWEIRYKEGPIPLSSIFFNMRGSKTIGTDSEGNPVYKYLQTMQTDNLSAISISGLEWDSYSISLNNPAAPPTAGLVGYWTFDENTGTIANDSTVNNNDGSFVNNPSWVALGKIGSALDFDGTDDYILVSDSESLSFPAGSDFTFTAWAKTDTCQTYGSKIISKKQSESEMIRLHCYPPTNKINWSVRDNLSVSHSVTGTTVITDNIWHHFVGVKNGNTISVYVDGILEASKETAVFTGNWNDGDIRIGYSIDNGNRKWDGLIDDLRIYNRALTSQEVQNLYLYDGTPPSDYDIALSCNPQLVSLSPGASIVTDLHLASTTVNSLLVDVRNSSGVLLDGVSIKLYRSSFNKTQTPLLCGQTFFSGLSSGMVSSSNAYSIDLSLAGYSNTTINSVEVSGASSISVIIDD